MGGADNRTGRVAARRFLGQNAPALSGRAPYLPGTVSGARTAPAARTERSQRSRERLGRTHPRRASAMRIASAAGPSSSRSSLKSARRGMNTRASTPRVRQRAHNRCEASSPAGSSSRAMRRRATPGGGVNAVRLAAPSVAAAPRSGQAVRSESAVSMPSATMTVYAAGGETQVAAATMGGSRARPGALEGEVRYPASRRAAEASTPRRTTDRRPKAPASPLGPRTRTTVRAEPSAAGSSADHLGDPAMPRLPLPGAPAVRLVVTGREPMTRCA